MPGVNESGDGPTEHHPHIPVASRRLSYTHNQILGEKFYIGARASSRMRLPVGVGILFPARFPGSVETKKIFTIPTKTILHVNRVQRNYYLLAPNLRCPTVVMGEPYARLTRIEVPLVSDATLF